MTIRFDQPRGQMYALWTPPKMVGEWRLGKTMSYVALPRSDKPNWFHRFMIRTCFGVYWYDYKEREDHETDDGKQGDN
jgi:hypothetical protein